MTRPLYVIAAPDVRPLLEPLLALRRAEGLAVHFLLEQDLPLRDDVRDGYVLLVGHPRGDGALRLRTVSHPPPYRHMRTPFHGDHALVHGHVEVSPRFSVGRLPARTTEELRTLVAHTSSPARMAPPVAHLIDGDPKWATAINKACNVLADHFSRLPLPGLEVQRTSFNPDCTVGRETLHARLREGARLVVYVGHGQPTSVDGVDARNLPCCHDGRDLPLAVLACCHAGRLDNDERGLSEEWLLAPGGPRAVIAASNVSDPRLNPAFALAISRDAVRPGARAGDAFLAGLRAVRDGGAGVVVGALRALAPARLRHAHLGLYNLLGDPSLPLGR
ncbi:MAG: C25 family cysteine peptidase [Myxococcota bacterium]